MIPYVRNNYNAIESQYDKEESNDFGQGQGQYKAIFFRKKKDKKGQCLGRSPELELGENSEF